MSVHLLSKRFGTYIQWASYSWHSQRISNQSVLKDRNTSFWLWRRFMSFVKCYYELSYKWGNTWWTQLCCCIDLCVRKESRFVDWTELHVHQIKLTYQQLLFLNLLTKLFVFVYYILRDVLVINMCMRVSLLDHWSIKYILPICFQCTGIGWFCQALGTFSLTRPLLQLKQ